MQKEKAADAILLKEIILGATAPGLLKDGGKVLGKLDKALRAAAEI